MANNATITRFEIAKKDIVSEFESHSAKVYTYKELSLILNKNKGFWRLPTNISLRYFIQLLLEKTEFRKYEFTFPTGELVRFAWGDTSLFQTVLSFRPNSYLTHYSAVYLHDLTEQLPKAIYVNCEQTEKPRSSGVMSQENIDRAFSRPQRLTTNVATYEEYRIHLLNGKSTGNLGVIEMMYNGKELLNVTNLERTLIDIAIRPTYSGGIHEIIKAYKRAAKRVSINKLVATLKELNYIYPYHQVIGFYLDKSAAYRESQIKLLDKMEKKYDFYTTYQMKEKEYSQKWKVYYPKGI